MACESDYFKDHLDLYYDWHRALDQVEAILKEFLGRHFAFVPTNTPTTWLQKAKDAETEKWKALNPLLSWCTSCSCPSGDNVLHDDQVLPDDKVLQGDQFVSTEKRLDEGGSLQDNRIAAQQ